MSIHVKNVARRPVDLEGGRVLAHGERGDAPDTPHTRAQIDGGLLVEVPKPAHRAARRGGDD
jgi:hypothetical protein